jgi:hypothetical protein
MAHNVLPHERLPFDRVLAKICLGKGNAFITHSQREAERLKAVLGCQIMVTCLPHPLADHFQKEKRAAARERLGYDPDDFLPLFFGLVRPYKGLDCLIQALGSIKQSGPLPQLLVAGEFWQKPAAFRKQISRLGLDEAVRLDNRYIPHEEIPRLFSAADLFVAPYIDGTQSGAVRLAMSFGLPILATEKALAEKALAEKALAEKALAEKVLAEKTLAGKALAENERDYPLVKIVPAGDASALAEGIRSWPSGWSPACPEQPVFPNGWDELVKELDRLAARKIMACLPDPAIATLVDDELTPAQLMACYGQMDALVAGRLHAGIFALGMGRPVFFIGYLTKTAGLVEMLGRPEWMLQLEDLGERSLSRGLAELWEQREIRSASIRSDLAKLKSQARQTMQMIAEDYNYYRHA